MAWPSMLSYTNIGKGRWIAKPLSPALKCKHTWNPSAQSLTLCNILSYPLYFSPSPDLVDYNSLKRSNPTHNLQNAFNVAEQKLGVTKLLDPEGEWLWTLCFLERRRVIVSGLAGNDLFDLFSIFFYRCFHREPRWEVHHHLRRGILPLLLQDETTRCWGQENRKGELEGWCAFFMRVCPVHLLYLIYSSGSGSSHRDGEDDRKVRDAVVRPVDMDRADHCRAEQPETCKFSQRRSAAASGLQHLPHCREATQVSQWQLQRITVAVETGSGAQDTLTHRHTLALYFSCLSEDV